MPIQSGVGTSRLGDPYEAGKQAATQALAGLDLAQQLLAIAFTVREQNQAEIMRGIREVTGQMPLLGGCAGLTISNEGIFADAVVVLALQGAELEVHQAARTGVRASPALVAEQIAEQIEPFVPAPRSGKHAAGIVLADGWGGTLAEVIHTMATILGPTCPLVGGGTAGLPDNLTLNDQTYTEGAAVALLTSNAPLGVGVYHGWMPAGQGHVITRGRGNRVYELGGQSAFDAYRDLFPKADLTPENLYIFATRHPLGLPQANGEFLIRDPVASYPDGSMEFAASVPENAVAHIMAADSSSLPTAATVATRRALAKLGSHQPAALLIFNCMTRHAMLLEHASDGADAELRLIRELVGPETRVAGFFCYGEIAAGEQGPSTFHNKTVAVCAIGT